MLLRDILLRSYDGLRLEADIQQRKANGIIRPTSGRSRIDNTLSALFSPADIQLKTNRQSTAKHIARSANIFIIF